MQAQCNNLSKRYSLLIAATVLPRPPLGHPSIRSRMHSTQASWRRAGRILKACLACGYRPELSRRSRTLCCEAWLPNGLPTLNPPVFESKARPSVIISTPEFARLHRDGHCVSLTEQHPVSSSSLQRPNDAQTSTVRHAARST